MKITDQDQRLKAGNYLKDQANQLENISAALMDLAVDNRENALEFYEAAHLAKRSADAVLKQVDRLYREWMDVENGDV
jgi:uncharacterized protein YigA (DUF484 family)